MLDYETFCRMRDHLGRQQLTVVQTARSHSTGPAHCRQVGRGGIVPPTRGGATREQA